MNEPEFSPLTIFVNWLPFLVFLVSILYFAQAFSRYTRERLKSQVAILAALDRIATAIEKR